MVKPVLTICTVVAMLTPAISVDAAQARDSRRTIEDSCWTLSFEEPFDALSLWGPNNPEGRWKTSYIWPRETIINNELQFYVDPNIHGANPFSITEGVLNITASRTPSELTEKFGLEQDYISGVLTTEKGFSQQYGRFEAQLKLPKGKGLWSAFWLLPSFDQWPEGIAILPEIDVMEHLGHEPSTFHTTLHTNQSGELKSYPYDNTVKADLTQDFHLYSVIWTPKDVTWYIDKEKVAHHPTPDDFTRPVHFLLNLAVGGDWPGNPDRTTQFPATYSIDYVRAFTDNGSCD
ncbi:MAG: glycoside hydrolase family 16 protein [Gammaproteobacteria bacterium]|nr:glycoside hydrolase family 16 protein [Gammaproteobacteria bacterium]